MKLVAALFFFISVIVLIYGLIAGEGMASLLLGFFGIILAILFYLFPNKKTQPDSGIGQTNSPDLPPGKQKVSIHIIISFMLLAAVLLAISFHIFPFTHSPSSTISPSSPIVSNSPAPSPTLAPSPALSPKTIYGKALIDGTTRSLEEKVHVISSAYYDRHEKDGSYKDGYESYLSTNNSSGYILSFFYADDYLYFAEVRDADKTSLVKLYYWDGELIACNDKRGDDASLCYPGSATFEAVASEFGIVYSIGKTIKVFYGLKLKPEERTMGFRLLIPPVLVILSEAKRSQRVQPARNSGTVLNFSSQCFSG